MSTLLLVDELGPRGKRTVRFATAAAAVVVGLVLLVAIRRLAAAGQLDAERWRPLVRADVARFLLGGLANTLKAALVAMGLALAVGGLLALGRLARSAPVRWLAGAYVEFFRGVPLILLILFSGLGLPKYGLDLPVFWFLVLALVAYNSAVLAEIMRAGVLSLDRGQSEAAYAIGLSYWQAMATVVLPQAVRRMVPAIVSQLVTLLKDTSLGYVITFEELLRRSRSSGEYFHNPLQTITVVALLYIAVNLVLSRIAQRLEVRQRAKYGAGAIQVAGQEELVAVDAAVRA